MNAIESTLACEDLVDRVANRVLLALLLGHPQRTLERGRCRYRPGLRLLAQQEQHLFVRQDLGYGLAPAILVIPALVVALAAPLGIDAKVAVGLETGGSHVQRLVLANGLVGVWT